MSRRRLVLLGVIAGLAACGGSGEPRQDSKQDEATAEATRLEKLRQNKQKVYDKGVELLKAGQHAEALRRFKMVQEVDPNYPALSLRLQAAESGLQKATARTPAPSQQADPVKEALSYLGNVSEVAWYEIDKNNVYIGFTSRPTDLGLVVGAAAFNGNKARDFGFHAWAVDAKTAQKGWRPGQPGYICSATCRHGKGEKNNCK